MPLSSYAIGERPGGYSQLRQKPYGLFGEPAWNSLGEYRRSRGADSHLPPGKPSDVTRIDAARPEDATLGYRPLPTGQSKTAAGFLSGLGTAAKRGLGWALRGGGPAFGQETTLANLRSRVGALGTSTLSGPLPAPKIRAVTPWGRRFFSEHGGNQWKPNTPEVRLEAYYKGTPAEPLMRQSIETRGAGPGTGAAADALELQALRQLTGDPKAILRTRPERDGPGWAPTPPQGWGPQRLQVPRTDYRMRELMGWLGLGGIPAAAAVGQGVKALNEPRAGEASPAIVKTQPPPDNGVSPNAVANTGGLGDMVANVGEHLGRNWLPYGAALGIGGGGLLLARHLQRKREEEKQRQLEEALLSKSGSVVARHPTAAGILAYCARSGYGEAQIRHTLVKAAGTAPDLADEIEGLFTALEPMVKAAIGAGYPSGVDVPSTPQAPAATPSATPAAPKPTNSVLDWRTWAKTHDPLGPGRVPKPLAPIRGTPATANMAQAYGAMRSPTEQAAAARWRQQLAAAERGGDPAELSRLRANRPTYTPQGPQAGMAQLRSDAQAHARGLVTPQEQQHLGAMQQAGIRDPQERILMNTSTGGTAAPTVGEYAHQNPAAFPAVKGVLPGMGPLGAAGRGLGAAARWALPKAQSFGGNITNMAIGTGVGTGLIYGGQAAYDKLTRPGPQAAPQLSSQTAPIAAEMDRQTDAWAASNGAKPEEIAAAKLQNQHLAATMSPEQQQAYAAKNDITLPRRYISEQGPKALDAIKTPEQVAEMHSNAVEGLNEILSKAKTEGGPNFDPNKAIPELTKPLTDLVHAAVRRGGTFAEDPEKMLTRMADGQYTPTEAQQIVNNIAGPQAPPEQKQQAWDFLQNADGPTKALLGIGVPVALLGMLSMVLGEEGMGGLLMTLLGGGAALYGASRAGLLPDFGLGSILGGGTGNGAPGPAAAGGGAAAPPAAATPPASTTTAPAPAPTPVGGGPVGPADKFGRLAALPFEQRRQELFPELGQPESIRQKIALGNRLAALTKQYSVPQLQRLLEGISPKDRADLIRKIKENTGGLTGLPVAVSQPALQALGAGGM